MHQAHGMPGVAVNVAQGRAASTAHLGASLRVCQAENFNGTMWCGRCRLHWNAAAPVSGPSCKPLADPPIGLAEMIGCLDDHVREGMASQVALVSSGLRSEPWGPALRKIAVFRAIAVLLERIRNDVDVVKRLRDR
jgi:hypothetical protein